MNIGKYPITSHMSKKYNNSVNPHVGIVLLNWNGYDDTVSCLESLSNVEYPNMTVLVVDNGSSDDSGERIEREFPNVTVNFTDENLGFSGGCNVGIENHLERDVDYVLLLNNDTVVEPDFLEPLVETSERHEDAAAVGSIIYRIESGTVWSAGGKFSPILARLTPNTQVKSKTPYETEFISGASLLLSREALEQLGTLDESFFYGFEDQEFAHRAWMNNWSLYIDPNSVVHHKVGGSSGEANGFRFYHATRNRLTFASMYLSRSEQVMFLIFFVATRFIRIVQWGILNRQESGRAFGILLALWDHMNGKDVRMPESFGVGPSSLDET